jgi:uncharacterized short protein YbdD (DUF466 family)
MSRFGSESIVLRMRQTARFLQRLMHAACGLPDYEAYVAHLRREHAEQIVPSYAEFFRTWQQARYGKGRSRCC